MRIGLIIPYRNAKKWLPRCLDSINGDFNVYLVSDMAPADEHLIAWNWGVEHNANVLGQNPMNEGVSFARNRGIGAALTQECDYITFLDADDELTPNAYKIMTDAIKAFSYADIIQFNHLREINGRQWSKFYNRQGDRGLHKLPGFWVGVWNKVYKASLIEDNDIRFDERLSHGEDELFNLRCLAKARQITCVEQQTVIHHFDNTQSLSKTTTAEDLIKEQSALIYFLERHSYDKELCEAVRIRQLELWDNPTYKQIFGGEA